MPATHPVKLVAIGGGTGLSTLLKGLKPFLRAEPEADGARLATLTAIVTVTDDGRSSGRLRGEFRVLPPGDIRNCLVALAEEDRLMTRLFGYRYPGDGELGGHALGNLIILALNQLSGDFLVAIDEARALLGITARVLPSTLDQVDLVARAVDRTVRGQTVIKAQGAPIQQLSLVPASAQALPAAVEAILAADLITLGPGSLFTSVIPNLLVEGIAEAIAASRATKIYICNVMTEADETDGFTAEDHVRQLLGYGRGLALDYVLFNSAPVSAEMRERYAAERAVPLEPPGDAPRERRAGRFIRLPLASEARAVRHDPARLSQAIFKISDRRFED
jgi:uncharacterized cofD-like protein